MILRMVVKRRRIRMVIFFDFTTKVMSPEKSLRSSINIDNLASLTNQKM